jgi:uncharacterized protein (TIGR02246 family)
MKRMLMLTVLVCVVSGLVASLRALEMSQAPSNRDDEAAIRRVIADQTAAFNRHEVDRALFTEDADFVNAQGIWLKGAAEIERARKAQFQRALKAAAIKLLDVRVRFVGPAVAIAHATYEISGMIGLDGLMTPPHEELSLRVLAKNNDRWLVTAFHITTISARQPPARQQ